MLHANLVLMSTASARPQTRPIPINKSSIRKFVTETLLPAVEEWLYTQPQSKPLGVRAEVVDGGYISYLRSNKKEHVVRVVVAAKPALNTNEAVGSALFSDRKVTLFLNGRFSPSELLEGNLAGSLFSFLIHEITHSADIFAPELTYHYSDARSETTRHIYVNDPSEVRAFMQQIVEETSASARNKLYRELAARKTDKNRALVDAILKASLTWSDIERHLNVRNRAKILKAVYDDLEREGLLFTDQTKTPPARHPRRRT